MARLQLELDRETLERLTDAAARERRPLNWQAEIVLRRGLGLPLSVREDGALFPQSGSREHSGDGDELPASAR